jgi:hypothetical protein
MTPLAHWLAKNRALGSGAYSKALRQALTDTHFFEANTALATALPRLRRLIVADPEHLGELAAGPAVADRSPLNSG